MPAKNLVRQILDQYKTANPNHTEPETKLLNGFGEFAEQWLRTIKIIGVGYTVNGMVLRTAAGEELVLDDSSATPPTNIPGYNAVGITGNAAPMSVTTPMRPSDFSITGGAG
jgi:hypothetical protein